MAKLDAVLGATTMAIVGTHLLYLLYIAIVDFTIRIQF